MEIELSAAVRRVRRLALRVIRPLDLAIGKSNKIVLGDINSRFRVLGWRTADIVDADYVVNLRDGRLPWASGSVDLLYTSHLIEHLTPDSAQALFVEILRVLKHGGVARFVCPDMGKLRRAYERKDLDFFLQPKVREYLEERINRGEFPDEALLLHNNLLRTHASYGDTGEGPYAPEGLVAEQYSCLDQYGFADWCVSLLDKDRMQPDQPWGHVNAWDFPKLKSALIDAGFSDVQQSSFRRSTVLELRDPRFDLERHQWISLYTEAVK